MHEKGDENYQRGYEWWLMREAKKVKHVMGNMMKGHNDQKLAVAVTRGICTKLSKL